MPDRILIADDNRGVRTALRHLLESIDHWEVLDVENGQQAVAQAQEFRPNLIILDLVMPVMDGLTAAREISKLLPDTPLLMHTLHWSPQLEVEAQKFGVRKLVPKADSRGLISAIQQSLASGPSALSPGSKVDPSNVPPTDAAGTPPVMDQGRAPTVSEKADAVAAAGQVGEVGGNRPPT
jgi:CheY-like chemotaxis protein